MKLNNFFFLFLHFSMNMNSDIMKRRNFTSEKRNRYENPTDFSHATKDIRKRSHSSCRGPLHRVLQFILLLCAGLLCVAVLDFAVTEGNPHAYTRNQYLSLDEEKSKARSETGSERMTSEARTPNLFDENVALSLLIEVESVLERLAENLSSSTVITDQKGMLRNSLTLPDRLVVETFRSSADTLITNALENKLEVPDDYEEIAKAIGRGDRPAHAMPGYTFIHRARRTTDRCLTVAHQVYKEEENRRVMFETTIADGDAGASKLSAVPTKSVAIALTCADLALALDQELQHIAALVIIINSFEYVADRLLVEKDQPDSVLIDVLRYRASYLEEMIALSQAAISQGIAYASNLLLLDHVLAHSARETSLESKIDGELSDYLKACVIQVNHVQGVLAKEQTDEQHNKEKDSRSSSHSDQVSRQQKKFIIDTVLPELHTACTKPGETDLARKYSLERFAKVTLQNFSDDQSTVLRSHFFQGLSLDFVSYRLLRVLLLPRSE